MKPLVKRACICLTVLAAALVLAVPQSAGASDCAKAELYYRHAVTKLEKEAEREYALRRAVELCPSNVKARVKLGESLMKLRKLDAAADEFDKALKMDSNLVEAHVGLGKIYSIQGRYEMAKKQYEAALKLNPADETIKAGLKALEAKISSETGGFKKAQDIVDRVTKSAKSGGLGNLMGFQEYTEAKDRIRFNNILFDEWSYQLKNESTRQLSEIGTALQSKSMGQFRVLVEGHTDNRGDLERNNRLSWDRANAVREFLMENHGIAPDKIETQGHGYSKPRFPNDSDEHRRENRRVEIVFFE
ncbi:MAG: OmpA family protein [Deltaproteobacteria bacterium]|nr:OmpA family protein [Deltaproteobacteria bacterium]